MEIPALPGCVTRGDTRADAAQKAEDAVQGWLVTALRFGDKVPEIDGFALSHLSDTKTGLKQAGVSLEDWLEL